jgi:hypothetical protein
MRRSITMIQIIFARRRLTHRENYLTLFGLWNRAAIRYLNSIESAIRHLARALKFKLIGSRRGERT